MPEYILELKDIHKKFGTFKVTNGISLQLEKGAALGIIGPNGAGKSTLFNLIAGGLKPDSGQVIFKENDVTCESVHSRCKSGIGRSYQIPHPFEKMTVFENLLVGAAFGTNKSEKLCYEDCAEILEYTGLLPKANNLAGTLTLLERKRLEMARALATQPELLLLDEIAGGLTEQECFELVDTVKRIHARGTSIVWIEHIVHALVAVVHKLMVIDFGSKLTEGSPDVVMNDPKVQEIYMGISAE
jgi:branched-chain amino acid transport system ATP-binding protein